MLSLLLLGYANYLNTLSECHIFMLTADHILSSASPESPCAVHTNQTFTLYMSDPGILNKCSSPVFKPITENTIFFYQNSIPSIQLEQKLHLLYLNDKPKTVNCCGLSVAQKLQAFLYFLYHDFCQRFATHFSTQSAMVAIVASLLWGLPRWESDTKKYRIH